MVMSSTDLVMAICLAVAVAILGAAISWALMDARRDSTRGEKHSPTRRSQNRSFKGRGG